MRVIVPALRLLSVAVAGIGMQASGAIPSITGIDPTSGSRSGGTVVSITGLNCSDASAVMFGDTPATSFTVDSDTQITAVSPPGAVGVRVTNADGTSWTSLSARYEYLTSSPAVASVSPGAGTEAGGTVVIIAGRRLGAASAVMFGDTPATSFTVDRDTQITAVSPGGALGTVDVRVTNADGTSPIVINDRFRYAPMSVEVTSNADSGAGSLRQALVEVGSGSTVTFHLPAGDETISIASELLLSQAIKIDGRNLAGSGTHATIQVVEPGVSRWRVFRINTAENALIEINDLTIRGGDLRGAASGPGQVNFRGGAISVETACTFNLSNSTVTDGKAAYGGGLLIGGLTWGISATLSNCTFTGNSARNDSATYPSMGGAIYSYGYLALFNCTLVGNSSTSAASPDCAGGAIRVFHGPMLLVDCTVTGNLVSGGAVNNDGGGICVGQGSVYLLNSIVVNNVADRGADIAVSRVGITPDVVGRVGAYYSWYDDRFVDTYGSFNEDPAAPNRTDPYTVGDLGVLSDNGGPTMTVPVGRLSPARRHGTYAYAGSASEIYFADASGTTHLLTDFASSPTVAPSHRIATDQRGSLRVGEVTIGACQNNAIPLLASLEGDGVEFTEGAGPVLVDLGSNVVIDDVDSPDFAGGQLTVSVVQNAVPGEDVLSIVNQGNGAGQIGVSGPNISYGGTIIGSFTGGTSADDLVVAFTSATATPEAVQVLVRNVTYSNANNTDPSTAPRTVRVTVNDGDGEASSNADITVNVRAVNDAPVVSTSVATTAYVEGNNTAAIVASDGALAITDGDSTTLASATITVATSPGGLRLAEDLLAFTNDGSTMGNIAVGNWDATNGVLSLVSVGATATLAEWQAALRAVTYENLSQTPSTNNRAIRFAVHDGTDTSAAAEKTVSVTATNDTPTAIDLTVAAINQSAAVAGATIGTLSSTDADDSSFTYTLATGAGDTNNAAFAVDGATLKVGGTPLAPGSYLVRVQTNDGRTAGIFARSVTITVVDNVPPSIVGLTVPSNATYVAGQNLDFVVTYNEPVIVTGAPYNILNVGLVDYAVYQAAGSTPTAIVFRYTVPEGCSALGGIAMSNVLTLGGGISIKDAAGNSAEIDLAPPSMAAVRIDSLAPMVQNVTSPTMNGVYKAGDVIAIQVAFTEPITVTGMPQLTLETGTTDRVLDYSTGSATNTLTFSYTVQLGDASADLDYIGTPALRLNGGTVKDAAGNEALLVLPPPGEPGSLAANKALRVDTVAPTVISIDRQTPASSSTYATSLTYRVRFTEQVTSVDDIDFVVTTVAGAATGAVALVSPVSGSVYDVTVNRSSSDGGLRLDLKNVGTAIADTAGNAISGGFTTGQIYTLIAPPPSKDSQTITFAPPALKLTTDVPFTLSATASSGLTVRFSIASGPATLSGNTVTLTGAPGVVTVRASQSGDSSYEAAQSVERRFMVVVAPPAPVRPPTSGSRATLSAGTAGAGCTYQWQCNGLELTGGTGVTLTLANVQPTNAGLYTYLVTALGGTTITSDPVIVGISTSKKVEGAADEVLTDRQHPNGNIYDQLLLQGAGAALTADPGQMTRISFVDLSNDIVQVEFSGAGSVSVVMDNASEPAPATNYNQPGVDYVRGAVGLVITGANETSHLTVFSVGRITAMNQALFRDEVTYDGMANIAFIAIQSTNGKFGGVRTGNVEYFAAKGVTGIYAPGVEFTGPVYVSDIQAHDTAQPMLVLGSCSDVRVTGGSLWQPNGRPVKVAGITQLAFTAGSTSHDDNLPAQANQGVLEEEGVDVTDLLVAEP